MTTKLTLMAVVLCLATSVALAQDQWAISPRVGTTGIGADLSYQINEQLDLRFGGSYFEYGIDEDYDGVEYDADLTLGGVNLILDYYPGESSFRISGGVVLNLLELDGTGEPTAGTYQIGNNIYTAGQVGTLSMDTEFNDFAPYLGIGWGRPFGADSDWTFTIDVGVLYVGDPDVSLTATGAAAGLQADINREVALLEEDIDDYEFFPVLQVGLAYRF